MCHFTACKNRQTDGYKFGWGKKSFIRCDQWHFRISLLLFLSLLSFCFVLFSVRSLRLFTFDKGEQTEVGGGVRGGTHQVLQSASPATKSGGGEGGGKGMNVSIKERGDPQEQSVAFRGFQRLKLAKRKRRFAAGTDSESCEPRGLRGRTPPHHRFPLVKQSRSVTINKLRF